MLAETPPRQIRLGSICARTPFPGRVWRRGKPLAMREMELSLAMIRSVTVTLQRPHLPCALDTGKPPRMLTQASPPPEPNLPPVSAGLTSLLTHPATNSLSACCVPSTTAEPRTLQGTKPSRTKLTS